MPDYSQIDFGYSFEDQEFALLSAQGTRDY